MQPVHIICACNASYNMPLCVMLTSLVEHFDPERELVIHIISNDTPPEKQACVRDSIGNIRPGLDHIELHWYSVDSLSLEKLPVLENDRFSRDTYARLFAPYLLPETCKRAVYIDCDTIVLADVADLYDSTANGRTLLHAVRDLGVPTVSAPGGVFDYAERGIPREAWYFNAGLLVIRLNEWRERDLTTSILEYIERHGADIHWVDQGAMNAFLYGDWTPLDFRWNETVQIVFPECRLTAGLSKEEWREAFNQPFMVHYSGPRKPWQKNHVSPRYSYFYEYLEKTVYKDSIPHRPRLENLLGRRAYYHLWRVVRNTARKVKNN
jgi:lipopolysaccharide biosynthesis glycosyltransferase